MSPCRFGREGWYRDCNRDGAAISPQRVRERPAEVAGGVRGRLV